MIYWNYGQDVSMVCNADEGWFAGLAEAPAQSRGVASLLADDKHASGNYLPACTVDTREQGAAMCWLRKEVPV